MKDLKQIREMAGDIVSNMAIYGKGNKRLKTVYQELNVVLKTLAWVTDYSLWDSLASQAEDYEASDREVLGKSFKHYIMGLLEEIETANADYLK